MVAVHVRLPQPERLKTGEQPPLPLRPPEESICPGLQSGAQSGMDISAITLLASTRL